MPKEPEEKEQSRGHNTPRLQTILQSYSDQKNVVLTQKETCGSMEQNGEPRNKPRYLWSINLRQRRQEYKNGKKTVSSTSGAGKVGQPRVNQ